jgi:hypothetical protein
MTFYISTAFDHLKSAAGWLAGWLAVPNRKKPGKKSLNLTPKPIMYL